MKNSIKYLSSDIQDFIDSEPDSSLDDLKFYIGNEWKTFHEYEGEFTKPGDYLIRHKGIVLSIVSVNGKLYVSTTYKNVSSFNWDLKMLNCEERLIPKSDLTDLYKLLYKHKTKNFTFHAMKIFETLRMHSHVHELNHISKEAYLSSNQKSYWENKE